jgi:HSP20 family protein
MANTLARYGTPQSTLTRLPDLVDQLFRDSFVLPSFWDRTYSGGTPRPMLPANLFETTDSYVMHLAIPGLNPENIDIQVVGREVTVKGKIELNTPENGQWILQGIPTGEFAETFTLPADIDSENVQASYDYGILSLGLPKAAHLRPKNIKVNVTK